MKVVKSVLTLVVAGSIGSAFAGAGEMTTVVAPLVPTVTYSTNATTAPARPALITYVGYSVSISNAGGNTINNIRFTGSTGITDTAELATFSSADGATCVPTNAAQTAIECAIGQLKAGESAPVFAVFFKAPVKVTNGVADGTNEDAVAFSGITYYGEGTGGVPNSVPQNSTENWASAAVTLGTFNPEVIKSALPKGGGSFFTGDGAITSLTDPFAVSVAVPQAPAYSTAEVLESDTTANLNCSSLGNFVRCYEAAITIPNVVFSFDSGSYLTIVLRVDKSNIKPGTKIGNVLLQYTDDVNNVHNLGMCANTTTPRNDGIPCIAEAVYYKNKSVSGWTPELDGDFEWTFLNLKNGRWSLN